MDGGQRRDQKLNKKEGAGKKIPSVTRLLETRETRNLREE